MLVDGYLSAIIKLPSVGALGVNEIGPGTGVPKIFIPRSANNWLYIYIARMQGLHPH